MISLPTPIIIRVDVRSEAHGPQAVLKVRQLNLHTPLLPTFILGFMYGVSVLEIIRYIF